MTTLAECIQAAWSPELGDPHPVGWLTVLVYLAAGLAAGAVAIKGAFPLRVRGRERTFWVLTAALMLFLAINKQLDLQSLLTAAARCHAQMAGWYEGRAAVQKAFVVGVAFLGVLALIFLAIILRGTLRRTGLALLGLIFVTGFVVIRAAGFHHVDAMINRAVVGLRLNWLLELPGPLLILAVALAGLRRGGSARR